MLMIRPAGVSGEGVAGLLSSRSVAMRPALTHLSTMANYNLEFDPTGFDHNHPPNKVSKTLFWFIKVFLFPTSLNNEFPPKSSRSRLLSQRDRREIPMAIDAISADRATAADRREAGRMSAHQYLLSRADARRDTRVEEAKALAAARPTVADRAAANPAPLPARLLDILA
jgi:hypothetical protein